MTKKDFEVVARICARTPYSEYRRHVTDDAVAELKIYTNFNPDRFRLRVKRLVEEANSGQTT